MALSSEARPRRALVEWLAVMVFAWIAFVAFSLSKGGMGLSWDALNHHIYLGWTADAHRFDRDFMAAGSQSYQFPYLYWPAYQLAIHGVGPRGAAVALATLQLLAVPPVWLLARVCIPGEGLADVAMRFMAVTLAFLSGAVLSMFDNTANDLLAAIPLLWALALAAQALPPGTPGTAVRWRLLASGFLAGVSVAFKLSNGPIAVVLPLLWCMAEGALSTRVRRVLVAGLFTLAGFALTYGYWGWLLWSRFGNPFFTIYDGVLAALGRVLGLRP